jgi:carboxypeptidase D
MNAIRMKVDQPPGTGYSYVPTNGYLHELDQAAAHLLHFIQNLYEVFPELQMQDVGTAASTALIAISLTLLPL